MLTNSAFQLVMGRIYKLYSPKWTFLTGILIFEIGSAVSGAAPNSTALIIGRAISGIGGSTIITGLMTIIFLTLPLEKRPLFQGFFGAVFALASVVGPLLGGVFTDDVTWRWCFYINLPIGGVSAVVIMFILHVPDSGSKRAEMNWKEQINQLDPIGNLCLLPGVVSLLLALQWGGTKYAWKDARIIALFILFGLLMIAFIAVQIWKKEKATVPPRLAKMRTMIAGMWYGVFNGGSMMIILYFLPIWFQAIKGTSAVQSGIRTIPLVLSLVVGTISSGAIISRIGYYTPFAIASALIMPIGAGLLTTLSVNSGHAMWIGYQVLFGFGLGLGMQQPATAAQTILGKQDIAIGMSMIFFTRLLGGAIFISVAENLFTNKLVANLSNIPGVTPSTIINAGALGVRTAVSAEHLPQVLIGYNNAVRDTFYLSCALSCLPIFGALALEWRSVKKAPSKPKPTEA
jgi:hypothetical protein